MTSPYGSDERTQLAPFARLERRIRLPSRVEPAEDAHTCLPCRYRIRESPQGRDILARPIDAREFREMFASDVDAEGML